jgi:hypothetical protein
MRRQIDPEIVRQVQHAIGLRGCHVGDHLVELGDIAAHDADLVAKRRERGRVRVDVHADDGLAARDQQRNDADADEAGAAEDEYGHCRFSLAAGHPRARGKIGRSGNGGKRRGFAQPADNC